MYQPTKETMPFDPDTNTFHCILQPNPANPGHVTFTYDGPTQRETELQNRIDVLERLLKRYEDQADRKDIIDVIESRSYEIMELSESRSYSVETLRSVASALFDIIEHELG